MNEKGDTKSNREIYERWEKLFDTEDSEELAAISEERVEIIECCKRGR